LRIDATSRRMTLHVISMRNPAMRLEWSPRKKWTNDPT
jgi:hypothetical protein